METIIPEDDLQPTPDVLITTPAGKTRDCNHCHRPYVFRHERSKFCSDKCRAANSKIKPIGNGEGDNTSVVTSREKNTLPSLPPAAQYIINHLEKENARWEKKYDDERKERKALKEKYDSLKERTSADQHKQALQGLEEAKPTVFERIIAALPPEATTHILQGLSNKFLTPGLSGTNGQLDGEASNWLNIISQWFCALPKESQTVAAGLIGELTKVQPDKLNEVITRMINILSNGTTIDTPAAKTASIGGF